MSGQSRDFPKSDIFSAFVIYAKWVLDLFSSS